MSEVFVATLAEGFKVIFEAQERERDARMTPEEREAEKTRIASNPLWKMWQAQKELNDRIAELDGPPTPRVVWLKVSEMVEPRVTDFYKPMPCAVPAVCECGVAITGGLHSDWCPCHEEPSL